MKKVGFGDLSPESQEGKVAMIVYSLLAIAPMAFVAGEIKNSILSIIPQKPKKD